MTITPDDKLKLIGLFMLNDDLQQQQEGLMRAATKLLDPVAPLDAVPVHDHISDALYGASGSVQQRVDELLTKMRVEVKAPVIAPAGENFFSMRNLEAARKWWRDFAKDETLETHYLSEDLIRIPAFMQWISVLSYESAINLYLETEMLQYHKDDIIMRALEGGLYFD